MPGEDFNDLMIEDMRAGMAEQDTSLERALGRVRQERYQAGTEGRRAEFGSASDPITIEGDPRAPLQNTVAGQDPYTGLDPSEQPEDQIFNPQSKRWRDAEHKRAMATMNRQKADRMRDFLSSNEDIDPAMRAQMMQSSRQLDQLADQSEKQEEARKSRFSSALIALEGIRGEVEQARVRAAGGVEEQTERGKYALQQKLQDAFDDMERRFDEADTEDQADRAMQSMKWALQQEGYSATEADEWLENRFEGVR